jgi:hypothetical protein
MGPESVNTFGKEPELWHSHVKRRTIDTGLKGPKNIQQLLKLFVEIPSSLEKGQPVGILYRGGWRFSIEAAPAANGLGLEMKEWLKNEARLASRSHQGQNPLSQGPT